MEISLEQKNEEIARMLGFIIKSYGSSTKEIDDNKVWCEPKHGLPVGELKWERLLRRRRNTPGQRKL